MKQAQIILRFLFPPYQNAAEAVHPAMRPFHNPSASLEAGFMFDRLGFFTSGSNVGCITKLFDQISYLTRIVSLIQRHTLRLLLCRFRTLYHNTFYRCLHHLAVMAICSIDCQADRHTSCLGQQTAFNTFFGPVRRVWACFFPRQAGPLSWRHPSIATTSLSLSARHNPPEQAPRVSGIVRLWSNSETASEPYCSNKYPSHSRRSIDSRFAIQRRCRPLPCGPALWAFRRRNDGYSSVSATTARSFPITGLKFGIGSLLFVFLSLNPFKGTIAFEYIGNSRVIRIGSK